MTRLIIFGKQGAGKGTQAERLAAHYEIAHVSTGDMFRATARSGSQLGGELRRYMDAGELVPDDVVIKVVEERLQQPDAAPGFILDGFPRTSVQAEKLEELLEGMGVTLDAVINLDVTNEEAIERITSRRVCRSCGATYRLQRPPANDWTCDRCGGQVVQRDDDGPDAVRRRLELFEQRTAPLLRFYAERGLFENVKGTGPPDEVFKRIVAAVDARRLGA